MLERKPNTSALIRFIEFFGNTNNTTRTQKSCNFCFPFDAQNVINFDKNIC